VKIRHKALIGLLPIALLSAGTFAWFTGQVVERVLVQEVTRRGLSISLNLSRNQEMVESFLRGEERRLLPPLQQALENAGAQYAMVLDLEGKVLAHTNVVETGKRYADAVTRQALAADGPGDMRIELNGEPVVDVSFPVWELLETTGGEEFLLLGRREVQVKRRLGTVRLGLSLREALETTEQISGQVLWAIELIGLLTTVLVLSYVSYLLRPVRHLAAAAERIGRGGLGETVEVSSRHEMGELAASFNRMSKHLVTTAVSKDFLDSVLRNMQDILLVTNIDGTIRLFNRQVQSLLDYEEWELIGQPVGLLFPDAEDPFAPGGLVGPERRGAINAHETGLLTRVGKELPVLLGVTTFLDGEEQVEGFVFTATDIAERKRSEEQIRRSLEEKELLLKEIHHRVKNNLQVISSLLSLQAQQIQDEEVLEMFGHSQHRVQSMALIHEKLYQSDELARVDFADYVRKLADNLFESYQINAHHIELELEIEAVLLGIDEAIPCGLIINELVLNALKYAFPDGRDGKIWVHMSGEGEGCYLMAIGDDGVGLPADLNLADVDSLGLRLVQILTQQLKGELLVERQKGTEFRIAFTAAG